MKLCELCSEKKDFPTNKTFPFPALYPLPICSLSAPYQVPLYRQGENMKKTGSNQEKTKK